MDERHGCLASSDLRAEARSRDQAGHHPDGALVQTEAEMAAERSREDLHSAAHADGSTEVAAVTADPDLAALREGVDRDWYLRRYDDLDPGIDPVIHYAERGWREGRDPNPGFSTAWYLACYPGIGMNPLVHYLRYGRADGRLPNGYCPGGVDRDWYLSRYADLAPGMDPAVHYAERGWREGRDPNPDFSTAWYLACYPGLGMNPLVHYLQYGRAEGRAPKPTLWQTIRAGAWWSWRIGPIFAMLYATMLHTHTSLASVWPLFLIVVAALSPGAAYVALINDLSDIDEDAAAGKRNRMAGRSPGAVAGLLACCLVPGLAFLILWRDDPLIWGLYFAAWVVFSLYSLRPVRLKSRGFAGVLADASGSSLFPTLVVVTLVYRSVGRPVDPAWFAAVAVWSLGFGLRGIIGHHLSDIAADAEAGVRTFVQRHGEVLARRLSLVFFGFELIGLGLVLWWLGAALPALVLVIYILLESLRQRTLGIATVVAFPDQRVLESGRRYQLALHNYYQVYLPLSVLPGVALSDLSSALLGVALFFMFSAAATRQECARFYEAVVRYYYPLQPIIARRVSPFQREAAG
jgi:1,4-dihydroxy-2-naphthoate octaprenyltransferase